MVIATRHAVELEDEQTLAERVPVRYDEPPDPHQSVVERRERFYMAGLYPERERFRHADAVRRRRPRVRAAT